MSQEEKNLRELVAMVNGGARVMIGDTEMKINDNSKNGAALSVIDGKVVCFMCNTDMQVAKENDGCLCNPNSSLHSKLRGEDRTKTETILKEEFEREEKERKLKEEEDRKIKDKLIAQELKAMKCGTCHMDGWSAATVGSVCNCKFQTEAAKVCIKLGAFETESLKLNPDLLSCAVCDTPSEWAREDGSCLCGSSYEDRPVVDVEAVYAEAIKAEETADKAGTMTVITTTTEDIVEETEEEKQARRNKIRKDAMDRNELIEMHEYMRPAFTRWDNKFVMRFIKPLGVRFDGCGNAILDIGNKPPTIIWSSHTDTVHSDMGLQDVTLTDKNILKLHKKSKSNCLGADDTVGVWLMMEMIRNQIPGRYIFHRSEERGCVGSNWILKNTPELLDGIRAAIAFDRRGTSDIIHTQRNSRCASYKFCESFAKELNKSGLKFSSAYGVYTDTAVYMEKIPECSNISVGYEGQHGSHESTDLNFALDLRDVLLNLDMTKVDIDRDPTVKYQTNHYHGGGNYQGYGQYGGSRAYFDWDNYESDGGKYRGQSEDDGYGRNAGVTRTHHKPTKKKKTNKKGENHGTRAGFVQFREGNKEGVKRTVGRIVGKDHGFFTLKKLVESEPTMVTEYLEQNGCNVFDILEFIGSTFSEQAMADAAKKAGLEIEIQKETFGEGDDGDEGKNKHSTPWDTFGFGI
jgi:hypothetical protein